MRAVLLLFILILPSVIASPYVIEDYTNLDNSMLVIGKQNSPQTSPNGFVEVEPIINNLATFQGIVVDGAPLTITGQGFGNGPIILAWEDFDSYSQGFPMPSSPEIGTWTLEGPDGPPFIIIDTFRDKAATWGGSTPFTTNPTVNLQGNIYDKYYISWRYKYQYPYECNCGEVNLFEVWGNGLGNNDPGIISGGINGTNWASYTVVDGVPDPSATEVNWPAFPPETTWNYMEAILDQSDPGLSNGNILLKSNYQEIYRRDNALTRNQAQYYWDKIKVFSGFTDSQGVVQTWLDEIYVAASYTRIEIGNAPTYEASTKRQLQIPTNWIDSEISFVVNFAAFSQAEIDAGLYLFIIDENNAVIDTVDLSNPMTGDFNINQCGTGINNSGTYLLDNDLLILDDNCIDIDASNVVLDCQGFSIQNLDKFDIWNPPNGVPERVWGVSVATGLDNITIKNCHIEGFNYGIASNANTIYVEDSVLQGNWNGFFEYANSVPNGYAELNNVSSKGNYYGFGVQNVTLNFTNFFSYQNMFGGAVSTVTLDIENSKFIENLETSLTHYDSNINLLDSYFKSRPYVSEIKFNPRGNPSLITANSNYWLKTDNSGFSQTCADTNLDGFCDSSFTFTYDTTNNLALSDPTPRKLNLGSSCGDGIVQLGEECDDGNTLNGDSCTNVCTVGRLVNNEILSCGAVLDVPGDYTVKTNLAGGSVGGNCITITSSNVNLDCQNNLLFGDVRGVGYSPKAIFVENSNNVQIINCNARRFLDALETNNSEVTVTNSEFFRNGIAIVTDFSTINVNNVALYNQGGDGIALINAVANLQNLRSFSNYDDGLVTWNSDVTITNSLFNNNSRSIHFENSNFIIQDSTFNESTYFLKSGFDTASTFSVTRNFWINSGNTGFSQTCTDTNLDGFCDSAYNIQSNPTITDTNPRTFASSQEPSCTDGILNQDEVHTDCGGSICAACTCYEPSTQSCTTAAGCAGQQVCNDGTYDVCVDSDPGDGCPAIGSIVIFQNDDLTYDGQEDACITEYVWEPWRANTTYPFCNMRGSSFGNLMKFDLSLLPSGRTIQSAVLELTEYGSGSQAGSYVSIHKLLKPWSSTGVTWLCTNDENHNSCADPADISWETNGAYGITDVGPEIDRQLANNLEKFSYDITNMVTEWYNNPSNNYGFVLRQVDAAAYIEIAHEDYGVITDRPKLTITFAPSGPITFIYDFDGNSIVDILDLYELILNFGSSTTQGNYVASRDYNSDGKINIQDLAIHLLHWD